jgi:MoaA/NifB/PqqE/SkfB family radical SAM enzyme
MPTDFVLKGLEWFKSHNPFCFHIFYGGEPLLREDLPIIINYCNKNNIFYTIISNNTDEIQNMVKMLFSSVEYVAGFTISIDPVIYQNNRASHRFLKSKQGYKNLLTYINGIKDPIAEITVDNNNIDYLIPLIEDLTTKKINSDITVIDTAKNKYYDFADITDPSIMLNKNDKVLNYFKKIISTNLNVHMADILLLKIFDILPSELDCNIQNNIHNLTIDADGSIRLCLRIRGIETSKKNLFDYINQDNLLDDDLMKNINIDKLKYCQGCNWTCPIMTIIDTDNKINHLERRGI